MNKKSKTRMRKILSVVLIFIFVSQLLTLSGSVAKAAGEEHIIDTPYEYPVKPNTKAWLGMPTTIERHAACDIPMDIVQKMTTDALVETVLTYPFFVDVMCYDTVEMGFRVVSGYFSGMDELLNHRNEQEVCLSLQKYLKKSSRYDAGIVDVNNDGKDDIEVIRAYARLLLRHFEGTLPTRLGELDISPLSYTTTVYTPKLTPVSVIAGLTWEDHGLTYESALQKSDMAASIYPNASEVFSNSISPSYNCHSYAWYSQLSSNSYWIDDPTPYLTDGSYVGTSPMIGCRVTYYGVESLQKEKKYIHSGVITSVGPTPESTYEISKWGYGKLYSHSIVDCPYYMNTSAIAYWKES